VGRSRLGDFTRPIPVDKRIFRRPRFAIFSGAFVLIVIATLAAAVFMAVLLNLCKGEQNQAWADPRRHQLARAGTMLASPALFIYQ